MITNYGCRKVRHFSRDKGTFSLSSFIPGMTTGTRTVQTSCDDHKEIRTANRRPNTFEA